MIPEEFSESIGGELDRIINYSDLPANNNIEDTVDFYGEVILKNI